MIRLSATRVSSFLRCKRKYWFQYVEKMPKLSNPSFKLGLACHESLELAGNIWMEKGSLSESDKKKVLDHFNKISVREGIEELEVHSEGRKLVKARIDKFGVGNRIISLEEKFGFPGSKYENLTSSLGVPLIGAMDKVVELDSETILVIDYKTSKTTPTTDQLKEDIQLSMYDLVAGMLWPEYKRVVLCLDMLKSDPVYTYRTPDQRADFNEYLVVVHDAMSSLTEDKATETLNVFCPWCDFKDYCKSYQTACSNNKYEFLPTSKLSDEQLIQEYQQLTSTSKILDSRKRELGMVIMEKIKASGTDLSGENQQMYIRQTARVNYDPREVAKIIPVDELSGMISLNKKAVDDYCLRNPRAAKHIQQSATTNYTTPFLAVKKIK